MGNVRINRNLLHDGDIFTVVTIIIKIGENTAGNYQFTIPYLAEGTSV